MTTLTIEQGNNIEIVSYAVIQKLYETALNSTNVTLSGNLQCEHCFENAYNYLTGYVTEGVKRFPDLQINVTDGKYISFADPNIQKVIVNNWSNGNPGITLAEISTHDRINFEESDGNYNTNNSFRGNQTITTFNELGRFTSIKAISRRQFQSSSLSSIDLSNIESIDWNAFQNCSNLTGVIDLPNIVSIGDSGIASQTGNLFNGCSGITEVNFGPNLTTFYSSSTFRNCSSLQKVTGFKTPNNNKIDNYCFSGCSSLTIVEGLDLSQVKALGTECFKDTPNFVIQNLSMPLLEGTIGNQCFQNSGVEVVSNLGTDILSLPYGAFQDCSQLTSVTIPNQITTINGSCFRSCPLLTTIDLNNVNTLGDGVFRQSGIQSIDLSNITNFNGNNTFYDCKSLTTITFPRTRWGLGRLDDNEIVAATSVFRNCTALTSITIPKEWENIPVGSFAGCSNVTTLIFEQGSALKTIGGTAFSACNSIQSVIIPEGVTEINGFAEIAGLKYIEFPSTTTKIGGDIFHHSGTGNWSFVCKATTPPEYNGLGHCYGIIRIYVPDASVEAYKTAWNRNDINGISSLPSQ